METVNNTQERIFRVRDEKFSAALKEAATKAGFNIEDLTIFNYCYQGAWGNDLGYAISSENKELENRAVNFTLAWHLKENKGTPTLMTHGDCYRDESPDDAKFAEQKSLIRSSKLVRIHYCSIGD